MATSKTETATVNPKDEQVVNPIVENIVTDDFSWDILEEESEGKTREEIIKECLADRSHFKLITGVGVKNVKAYARISKRSNRPTTRLTFVVKSAVPGTIADKEHLDAFGDPTRKVGMSTNVFVSAYATGGAMKENAKTALFADEVSKMTDVVVDGEETEIVGRKNIANLLFAGGTIDVLCQFVKAGTPYKNPFASGDDDPETFEEDRIFHHIVKATMGEAGNDMYRAMLLG